MQEKLSTGIPTRSNTNQPVQPQKVAKSLKFHTKLRCCQVPCMELQQRHTVMICTLISAYAAGLFLTFLEIFWYRWNWGKKLCDFWEKIRPFWEKIVQFLAKLGKFTF